MKETKVAELALIRAIPDSLIPKTKPGRLQGRLVKLRTEIDKMFNGYVLQGAELEKVQQKIMAFAEKSGWEGKEKHVCTAISFMLAMIEDSEHTYPEKITELLNDILDYFERKKTTKQLCYIAGDIAAKKWRGIK